MSKGNIKFGHEMTKNLFLVALDNKKSKDQIYFPYNLNMLEYPDGAKLVNLNFD